MTIAAKVASATLGVVGVVVTGCYVGGVFGEYEGYYFVSEDVSIEDEYKGKIGERYGMYLVSATNWKNKSWWKKAYIKYQEDATSSGPLSAHFAKTKVTSDYNTRGNSSLNKVCGEAYKKDPANDVDFYSTDHSNEKYKLAVDILKYCSPLEKAPIIISEGSGTTQVNNNTIGKSKGNEKKLVSVTSHDNKVFWEVQHRWFKTVGNATTSIDVYFDQFFEGVEGSKRLRKSNYSIKDICEGVYAATAPSGGTLTKSAPTAEGASKYCSFIKTI